MAGDCLLCCIYRLYLWQPPTPAMYNDIFIIINNILRLVGGVALFLASVSFLFMLSLFVCEVFRGRDWCVTDVIQLESLNDFAEKETGRQPCLF